MSAAGRVHDLSAALESHMPVWPTSPLPVIEPIGIIARDGYAVERVSCLTHTGTHVDAPYHFLEDGRTIDQIPPADLVGKGALLDLRSEIHGPVLPRAALEAHWPKGWEPEIVLLETGWSALRSPTKRYLYDFPGIDPAAAAWLVERRVKGVGIDSLGIDPFSNAQFEAHKVLLRKGIWIAEAMDHLDELREGVPYTVVVAPLRIRGASGAMSRIFALEP
jgi:arylformamidase